MCDFLEDKYLREQVESINEIGKFITNLKRVGTGLGEYMFDKEQFDWSLYDAVIFAVSIILFPPTHMYIAIYYQSV